jgi:hypothetical protein
MEATVVQGGNDKVSHVWKIMGKRASLHNNQNYNMLREGGPASGAVIAFCFASSLVMYFVTKRQLDAQQREEEKRLGDTVI